MVFNKNSIDFVKTHNNIHREFNLKKPINKISYSYPLVKMAVSVVNINLNIDTLLGIRKCIMYEIEQFNVDYYSFLWCKHKIQVFDSHDDIMLIADSLILTVMKYKTQLNERHTGLSSCVIHDIVQGIEWVGNWTMRGYPIVGSKNKLISTHDIDELRQFIA